MCEYSVKMSVWGLIFSLVSQDQSMLWWKRKCWN